MLDLATVFDRQPTRRPAYRLLLAELWAYATRHPAPPPPESLPDGGGRPVLVIPALLTGDAFTGDLRRYLARCGFRVFGWQAGINWGPTPRVLRTLEARVRALRARHGRLALVGISLGGILARNAAYEHPDDISHVVTLASPFRLPTASTVEPVVRLLARGYGADLRPARLSTPLPVPSTMIFTREDGVVAWDSCFAPDPAGEALDVGGPHLTITSNPAALRAIVRRLAGGP